MGFQNVILIQGLFKADIKFKGFSRLCMNIVQMETDIPVQALPPSNFL
jgi:hypothetical protein